MTKTYEYHRFLDEAGDTTFYGKKKSRIVGEEGVSKAFILGMLKINEPLDQVREKVIALQNKISQDPYFAQVPSIQKKIKKSGYFLHAKDDVPEVRKEAYEMIKTIDCSFEAIVARKVYDIYENKHEGKEQNFYADLLSHILKDKFEAYPRLVLNISQRGKSTTNLNLELGLNKAMDFHRKSSPETGFKNRIKFNVQTPITEPLLNLADYFCWAIQRVFERGETRYYKYMADQISVVVELFDDAKDEASQNYYKRGKNELIRENLIKIKKAQ